MNGSATRFTATTHCFALRREIELLDAKEPEAAGGNLVGAQAFLRFQLLLHVLDASFCTIMLVVGAMVVESIAAKVRSPSLRIQLQII